MAEFALPATPADEDLYNELLNAEVHVVELRRRHHQAECSRLDELWNASTPGGEEDSDGR